MPSSQQDHGPLSVYVLVKVNKNGFCLETSVPTLLCSPGAILRASGMRAGNHYLQRMLGPSQLGGSRLQTRCLEGTDLTSDFRPAPYWLCDPEHYSLLVPQFSLHRSSWQGFRGI